MGSLTSVRTEHGPCVFLLSQSELNVLPLEITLLVLQTQVILTSIM